MTHPAPATAPAIEPAFPCVLEVEPLAVVDHCDGLAASEVARIHARVEFGRRYEQRPWWRRVTSRKPDGWKKGYL